KERVWVSSGSLCCFFFQAEDGIRALTVTGVQTCALPIWDGAVGRADVLADREIVVVPPHHEACLRVGVPKLREARVDIDVRLARSEERRVGKECTWRWCRAQ